MRGYMSTKQRSYLAPFTAASGRIEADFALAFKSSETANAQSIEPTLLDAESNYKQWLGHVAAPLVAGSSIRDAAGLQSQGKSLMDRMRSDIAHALDVLDDKSASYSRHTQEQLRFGAIVSVLIGLALCSAIAFMLGIQRRIEGERDRFVNSAQDMFVVAGMNGHFLDVNPATERILGRTRAELLKKPFISFVHPDDVARTIEAVKSLSTGQSLVGFRNRYQAADGTYRWMCWNSVPDVRRRITYASGRDETDRVAFEMERDQLAYNDLVTGLPNRASFLTRTSRALAAAHAAQTELAVILFDLDGFKAVNDAYGHSAGDAVLRELAQRVRSVLREADLVARIGGDEFTILLQAHVGSLDVDIAVRKIESTFCEPLRVLGHEMQVNASIGVARYPQDGDTTEALLARADEAMYRAKRLAGHALP